MSITGFANVTVRDCTITNCAGSGIGVLSSGGTVFCSIDRVRVNGCSIGMNGNTGSRLAVRDCDLSLNSTGLICQKTTLNSRADLDTCLFACSGNAIQAGPGATTVRLINCTINNNTTALYANGGTFYSAGNNKLMGNTSDGATPTIITQK